MVLHSEQGKHENSERKYCRKINMSECVCVCVFRDRKQKIGDEAGKINKDESEEDFSCQ